MTHAMYAPLRVLFTLTLAARAAIGFAATPNAPLDEMCSRYERTNAMVPMRDGVRLYTEIYRPKARPGPFGILLVRTPYETIPPGDKCSPRIVPLFGVVDHDNFIVVIQSIRGRYKSQGQFILLPPPTRLHSNQINQTTDAWDSVDWLVKHVPGNNGKVALAGVSYDGWLALMAALDSNPHVVAVSTQGVRMDQWMGDDFWRHGALRLDYAFEYAAFMELSRTLQHYQFDDDDVYDWFLRLGPIKNVDRRYFHGRSEFWNALEEHQVHDAYWQPRTTPSMLAAVRIPVLVTAGWWDAEDFYGSVHVFDALTRDGRAPGHFHLVIGPWEHGGWDHPPGRELGNIDFGSDTASYWLQGVERAWLDHLVLGSPDPHLPAVVSFRTGTNQWMAYDRWPPKARGRDDIEFTLTCDGQLARAEPHAAGTCSKSYVSDPADPVPYLPRPIAPINFGDKRHRSPWPLWEIQDQRFAANRPDTLLYATPPLAQSFTFSGQARLTLHVTTTATDGDFIVKLMDIYPGNDALGGYYLMLDHATLAGRYLHSLTQPEPLHPGQVYELHFDFVAGDHVFLQGHRIAIQIQSTLFPVLARNPQTFRKNIFGVKASDYRAARIAVVSSPGAPNVLTLPSD